MQTETNWDNSHGPIVNGKVYPMWGQFVMKKDEWIGGTLVDNDPILHMKSETMIKDITLEPNGDSSAMFTIVGEKFNFGCDVQYLGISGDVPKGFDGLKLSGYMGHSATITKRTLQ